MKVVTSKNGKKSIKISKEEWLSIGKKAAWEPADKFPDKYGAIPERMMASLRAYVMEGRPVGNFLSALLSNNLMETFAYADDENIAAIKDYVKLVYNFLPGNSHGSADRVRNWIASHPSKQKTV